MVASECAPYAKTGGLADVVGALPCALKEMGHEVIVVTPKYLCVEQSAVPRKRFFHNMCVWMGNTEEWCAVDVTMLKGVVPVFFIENDKFFHRDGLYHDAWFNDFQDNPRRFAFLSRAALQLCRDMGFSPDIVHGHDWQGALAAAYLKVWHWNDPVLGRSAGVLTIHNIAYQGIYGAENYDYIGLQQQNFTPDKFNDAGRVNFLRGGVYFADMVTTVSPGYARETLDMEKSYGMAPFLHRKGSRYRGILNGADYEHWNPETDTLIPHNYSLDDLSGKWMNKQKLQEQFGLEVNPGIPLIGIVSRFVYQKGLDIFSQCIQDIMSEMIVQFVILGSGDMELEAFFRQLPGYFPGKIASYIGYSNELAHWIEAGSDFFLMPSRYEPCGLNQIYSLRYGTLPIVRATGGLDDTVEQYNEATGEGTGFKFYDPTPPAIKNTVGWAVSTYFDRPQHIRNMIHNAMTRRFSWHRSAEQYVDVYHAAIHVKHTG